MLSRTLLITAVMILPATAYADVRYEMQTKDMERGGTINNEILVKDGMLRMGVTSSSSGDMTDVIYKPADDEMIMLDGNHKVARRMTKADIDRMGGMMAGVSQQMQEALKNMPPEARAKAEAMMKKMGNGSMPGASATDQSDKMVKPMGSSDTVAGINCDMYEMMLDGKKTQEFCAADADDLKGGEELVTAMSGMAKFMEGLTKATGGHGLDAYVEPVEGKFPILARQFENGKEVSESRLVSAEETSISADKFEVPKGYKERKLME
jgi:hypothetical protein